MVTKVVMPRLSLTMKMGTVGKWYKKEGDKVEKGEPVAEVVSEKATYDLEAPESGILRKITVQEGVDAAVGAVLALIASSEEPISEADLQLQSLAPTTESSERVLASPAAKRLAREHSIELSLVESSTPDGRISEDDVRRFIEEDEEGQLKVKETIVLRGLRKTSAERVSTSFKTAPHSTLMMETDMSRTAKLHETGVSYTAIFVQAVAKALTEHPLVNSTITGETIRVFENVNTGIAVETENGLIVPVVHNADKKTLQEIDAKIKELTGKAKEGKLTKEDLTDGTFTITNLGMYNVDFFTPIINPPEAAILGVGKIAEKPVVVNGKVEIKPMLMLSLSYDHRVLDGAPAANFLNKVKQNIEART